jgi:hypothetical protein
MLPSHTSSAEIKYPHSTSGFLERGLKWREQGLLTLPQAIAALALLAATKSRSRSPPAAGLHPVGKSPS